MKDVIKIGLIRCDVHAAWYAPLIQEVNEKTLLEYWPQCQYYHFYRNELKFPRVEGFKITKIWDHFPIHPGCHPGTDKLSNAEMLSEVLVDKPAICETLEEVSDDVDLVFIACCQETGKDHLELATPGIKKGIPTFIDKPMAYNFSDVKDIICLAEKNNTPVMSLSLLRINPLIDQFKRRFDEIAPIGEAFVKSIGSSGLNASIHGLSLAQHLFGEGVESVDCMGKHDHEIVRLHYPYSAGTTPHGFDVLIFNGSVMGPNCGFQAIVYGDRSGPVTSPWINDYNFPLGGQVILEEIKEMVKTRQPQMPYSSLLELFKIVDAGRIARDTGKKILLANLD